MALVFMDNLTHYNAVEDLIHRWYNVDEGNTNNFLTFGDKARLGGRSISSISYSGAFDYELPHGHTVGEPGTEIYVAFDFYVDSPTLQPLEQYSFFGMLNSGTTDLAVARANSSLSLGLTASGSIVLYRTASTTKLTTSINPCIFPQTLHRIEVCGSQDNAGMAKVWVDGVLVIDYAGPTYNAGGVSDIKHIRFAANTSSTSNTRHHFGNFVICDRAPGLGSDLNVFPLGPVTIETLTAEHLDLDEVAFDKDATYVSIDDGRLHSYPVKSALGTTTALAAQAYVSVRSDDVLARRFELSSANSIGQFVAPVTHHYNMVNLNVDLAGLDLSDATVDIRLTDVPRDDTPLEPEPDPDPEPEPDPDPEPEPDPEPDPDPDPNNPTLTEVRTIGLTSPDGYFPLKTSDPWKNHGVATNIGAYTSNNTPPVFANGYAVPQKWGTFIVEYPQTTDYNGAFTFSGWFFREQTNEFTNYFMMLGAQSSGGVWVCTPTNAPTSLAFRQGNGPGEDQVTPWAIYPNVIPLLGWFHLAVTSELVDGRTLFRFYVNGVEVVTHHFGPEVPKFEFVGHDKSFLVGSSTGLTDFHWPGRFDDIATWRRTLSSNEIKNIYWEGRMDEAEVISPATHVLRLDPAKSLSVPDQLKNTLASYGHNYETVQQIPFAIDSSLVTIFDNLFYGYRELTVVPELDTSIATSMEWMFAWCYGLREIPLLDTSRVTSMNAMFYLTDGVVSFPNLNTSNVTDMGWMFYGCTALVSAPLLDTSKVENMEGMYSACNFLVDVPLMNTANVTNMGETFNSCSSLTTVSFTDTSKVTNMNMMFNWCEALEHAPVMDTSNVTDMYMMFCDNYALVSVPDYRTHNVLNVEGIFYACSLLTDGNVRLIGRNPAVTGDELPDNGGWAIEDSGLTRFPWFDETGNPINP